MSKRAYHEESHGSISSSSKRFKSEQDERSLGSYPTATARTFSHEDYTVGWICALPCEMAAAKALLDDIHPSLPIIRPNDHNTYILGEIGVHNVVIACLPLYGTTSAATVAIQMLSSFESVRFGLMVGIGEGVPSKNADIRLGDVVVGKPDKEFGGVVQYDYDKAIAGGRFERSGRLAKPPPALLTAVSTIQANHMVESSRMPTYLSKIQRDHGKFDFTYLGHQQDRLFQSDYDHVYVWRDTCFGCDPEKLLDRPARATDKPMVHYGLIASGNWVTKHGGTRDQLARELGILCFEMEAAGLMDEFPCLVIRGISDYADSHKNKQWQHYAAATAAAYAKDLLSVIPATRTTETPKATTVTSGAISRKRQLLMDALGFDRIDARQETVQAAHIKTCKWLLSKPEYQDWLDGNEFSQHHSFLWIKGKPGTGKSTLMKFAFKQAKKMMRENTIITSFFFDARGEELEKSTTGMYRSLLFQLLKKVPELQVIFDSLPPAAGNSDHYRWNIETLKELFHQAVEGLNARRLICFIDALDECEGDQVQDMINFFEGLGKLAASNRIQLHICFLVDTPLTLRSKKGGS
jgi:nucleoside phosphorylase